jgi:hypothetical protein
MTCGRFRNSVSKPGAWHSGYGTIWVMRIPASRHGFYTHLMPSSEEKTRKAIDLALGAAPMAFPSRSGIRRPSTSRGVDLAPGWCHLVAALALAFTTGVVVRPAETPPRCAFA